jgi:hypothetical protein
MSIDPDWSGGGFGKYKGLSLREIDAAFAQCVSHPSSRSIAAVLRITREQIEARGGLGKQPYYAVFFLMVALAAGLVALGVGEIRDKALIVAGALGFVSAAFAVGSIRVRKERNLNLVQEREIRRRAGLAIEEMLKEVSLPEPLTREQRETLSEISKEHRLNL